jgi:hypothetical protein
MAGASHITTSHVLDVDETPLPVVITVGVYVVLPKISENLLVIT